MFSSANLRSTRQFIQVEISSSREPTKDDLEDMGEEEEDDGDDDDSYEFGVHAISSRKERRQLGETFWFALLKFKPDFSDPQLLCPSEMATEIIPS